MWCHVLPGADGTGEPSKQEQGWCRAVQVGCRGPAECQQNAPLLAPAGQETRVERAEAHMEWPCQLPGSACQCFAYPYSFCRERMTSGVLSGARMVGEPKICSTRQRSKASGPWKQAFHTGCQPASLAASCKLPACFLGSPWRMPSMITNRMNEMLSRVGPAAACLPGDAVRLALPKVLLH